MVNQNKIFSYKIKRQEKQNVFPHDVEQTVENFSLCFYNVKVFTFKCFKGTVSSEYWMNT